MRTTEGDIVVQVPQVRDAPETHCSRVMTFLRGNSDVLERLAVEMYARGFSTRDIEDAPEDATGDRLLSRTAVSQITAALWDECEAFGERDLSELEVRYLFLDTVYESLRQQGGGKIGVVCAWAICVPRHGQPRLTIPPGGHLLLTWRFRHRKRAEALHLEARQVALLQDCLLVSQQPHQPLYLRDREVLDRWLLYRPQPHV